MKKLQIVILVLAALLCAHALLACVETPSDVTMDADSWKPNDRNEPATPGTDDSGSNGTEEPDGNGVGIGENTPIELPFLPVS